METAVDHRDSRSSFPQIYHAKKRPARIDGAFCIAATSRHCVDSPSTGAPEGIHAAIWSELADDPFRLPGEQRLTMVSYSAGDLKRALIEPVAVGDTLPEMPLFLEPERYVLVPLEATYQAAFEAVPQRWREVLATGR